MRRFCSKKLERWVYVSSVDSVKNVLKQNYSHSHFQSLWALHIRDRNKLSSFQFAMIALCAGCRRRVSGIVVGIMLSSVIHPISGSNCNGRRHIWGSYCNSDFVSRWLASAIATHCWTLVATAGLAVYFSTDCFSLLVFEKFQSIVETWSEFIIDWLWQNFKVTFVPNWSR